MSAPGVVSVRLSGLPADIAVVAALLAGHGPAGVTAGQPSSPQANRHDPGVRVYLTVVISRTEEP